MNFSYLIHVQYVGLHALDKLIIFLNKLTLSDCCVILWVLDERTPYALLLCGVVLVSLPTPSSILNHHIVRLEPMTPLKFNCTTGFRTEES